MLQNGLSLSALQDQEGVLCIKLNTTEAEAARLKQQLFEATDFFSSKCSKLQEFCAAAHCASVTRFRERTNCAQHKVYIGGVRKPGSTCHSLIVSDGPTVSLKSQNF